MPVFAPRGFSLHEVLYDFGPYIAQQRIVYGVDRFGKVTDAQRCPESLVGLQPVERLHAIEDEVRRDFGFPRRGINNQQETLLALVIRRLFPAKQILRRHRPAWLGRLELDVVVEDLRVAFEFQGMQHQRPMEHLGGKAAFDKLRARDEKKAKLCKDNGYVLIPIYEGDEVPLESAVRTSLSRAGIASELPPILSAITVPWDFTIKSERWCGRWTNSRDGLFLQGTSDTTEWSVSGFDLCLHVVLEGSRVKSITVESGGDARAKVTMEFASSDSPTIHQHRKSTEAGEFFLAWAMLDPRITVRQSDPQGNVVETQRLQIPLSEFISKKLPQSIGWPAGPASVVSAAGVSDGQINDQV
jgi:hypothetical protein